MTASMPTRHASKLTKQVHPPLKTAPSTGPSGFGENIAAKAIQITNAIRAKLARFCMILSIYVLHIEVYLFNPFWQGRNAGPRPDLGKSVSTV
jgi:hypothetical protein